MSRQGSWRDEHGFTLGEVLITIILMGILFAIASSTWFGVIESRQVDSATNQLVSDLRLANSKATNRLTSYQVVLTTGSDTYEFGPVGDTDTRTLPDGVMITIVPSPTTIGFQANGSATGATGVANQIVVSSTSPPSAPQHGISINPATARVRVDS